jgi:hypothetical protein
MKINEQFLAQMRDAAQLLQTEGPMAATAAVQRALNGGAADSPFAPVSKASPADTIIDINPASPIRRPSMAGLAQRLRAGMAMPVVEDVDTSDAPALKGKFLSLSCSAPAGTRAYKLYIPSTYTGATAASLPSLPRSPGKSSATTRSTRPASMSPACPPAARWRPSWPASTRTCTPQPASIPPSPRAPPMTCLPPSPQ